MLLWRKGVRKNMILRSFNKMLAPAIILLLLAGLLLTSAPGTSPVLQSQEADPDTLETPASTTRQHSIALRLNSPQPGKLLVDRAAMLSFLFLWFPVAIPLFPRTSFRPFFYLLKKRVLLLPIKFTSMFLGFKRTSLILLAQLQAAARLVDRIQIAEGLSL